MARKKKAVRRQNPVPLLNPKNGPPVYFPTEPGAVPEEVLRDAVRSVLAARGALHPAALAEYRKSRS